MSTSESPVYHHPDQPVRHSYPLAIREAGLGVSFNLLMKTLPYMLARFGILVAVSIITLIWISVTIGGTAFLGQKIHPWVGYAWLGTGLGVYGYVWRTIVRYFLYLLKCGHIAVLTELITHDRINNQGLGMFAYGKKVVTERFKEVNVLFLIDALIAGVVGAFNRTLNFVGGLLPIPGVQNLTKAIGAVLHAATTYIDETIFSYNLARGDTNPWRSGRDGLVYYCQNAKGVLKTAVGCVLLDYLLTAIVWGVMFLPAFLLAKVAPFLAGWTLFAALLFAWNFRAAVLKPLFLTMIMTKFHVSAQGQAIDETWDARLTSVSGKFAEIKQGIQDWWTKHPQPEGQPAAAGHAPPPPPPPPLP
jgi:hypothetical protein